MASKVEFPIRLKLLLLISLLVLAANAAYLALAVKLFKDDKTSLIYELNASNVKTLAAQTESTLLKISDKVKLLTQGHRELAWTKAIFEAEPDLIAYTLFRSGEDPSKWNTVTTIRNSEYLKLYGLSTQEVDHIREQIPIPFPKVLAKRTWAMNSTLQNGAPIMTLAMAIEIQEGGRAVQHVAVVDVRLDRILKLMTDRGIATVYLVDAEGRIVAHPDASLLTSRASFADVPMVQEAIESPVALQLKPFKWKEKRWLGAYAPVGIGGLTVVSQVEEDQAFRAAKKLIDKSVLFALVVFTAALLISSGMARSFTDPIHRLMIATERLSRWEFGESIHVKTRDEIGKLARAFNAMASDLQTQRAQIEANQTELERKVKERTAALESQKKQLSEVQDTLIRTTRLASLGELAGAAAHEVLNPLNNMNIRIERIRDQLKSSEKEDVNLLNEILAAWTQTYQSSGWDGLEKELKKPVEGGKKVLVEEDLDNLTAISKDLIKRISDRQGDMDFLGEEISRITRILNNMRSLSRVGGERKPLDIHVPIDETAITLSDIFEKRKVQLLKEFGAESRDVYTIVGDKDELIQVFSNLIRNAMHAIDAAKRRAGIVKVSTRRSGNRVEIRITDNGTGIKKEHLSRIFEPSFTTKSVEEGTGLGLSISRRLVRAFGGDIEVEQTAEGDGTTFLIWLPAAS